MRILYIEPTKVDLDLPTELVDIRLDGRGNIQAVYTELNGKGVPAEVIFGICKAPSMTNLSELLNVEEWPVFKPQRTSIQRGKKVTQLRACLHEEFSILGKSFRSTTPSRIPRVGRFLITVQTHNETFSAVVIDAAKLFSCSA